MKHSTSALLISSLLFLATIASASEPWPAFKKNPERTSVTDEFSDLNPQDIELIWSAQLGRSITSSPVIYDLDDDGRMEILVGSSNGILYALSNDGQTIFKHATDGRITSTPLVSDINEDGHPEIIFGSEDGTVTTLDSKGRLLWKYYASSPIFSSPISGDFDEKRGLTTIVGVEDGHVMALNSKGKLLWKYKTQGPVSSSAALYDITGDGLLDVIIGSDDGHLYILDKSPYSILMHQTKGEVKSTPTVVDVDADGETEIIFGSGDGKIYAVSRQLSVMPGSKRICANGACVRQSVTYTRLSVDWNITTRAGVYSSPAVGDINDDGELEVVVGSDDKTLYIISSDGTKIKSYSTNGAIESPPTLADLNNDRLLEIIFGSNDGIVYVLNSSFDAVFTYNTGAPVSSQPAVSDINNDGVAEIIAGSDNGNIHVFGAKADWEASARKRQLQKTQVKAAETAEKTLVAAGNKTKTPQTTLQLLYTPVQDPLFTPTGLVVSTPENTGSGDFTTLFLAVLVLIAFFVRNRTQRPFL